MSSDVKRQCQYHQHTVTWCEAWPLLAGRLPTFDTAGKVRVFSCAHVRPLVACLFRRWFQTEDCYSSATVSVSLLTKSITEQSQRQSRSHRLIGNGLPETLSMTRLEQLKQIWIWYKYIGFEIAWTCVFCGHGNAREQYDLWHERQRRWVGSGTLAW